MQLAYFRRLLDSMDRARAQTLYTAIVEGRDDLASKVRQCKEHDANVYGVTPMQISQDYAAHDNEIAFLDDVLVRLAADLSVPERAVMVG